MSTTKHPQFIPGIGIIEIDEEYLEDYIDFFDEIDRLDQKTCECGSVAVYGKDTILHSDWCPRYI